MVRVINLLLNIFLQHLVDFVLRNWINARYRVNMVAATVCSTAVRHDACIFVRPQVPRSCTNMCSGGTTNSMAATAEVRQGQP